METRMIECPHCNGEGGHVTLTGYDPRNGEPTGYWTTCHACEGRREIEIEVEPIQMEDLEMGCPLCGYDCAGANPPIAGCPLKDRWEAHASDCAIHNAPALPVGPCDCGASPRTGGPREGAA